MRTFSDDSSDREKNLTKKIQTCGLALLLLIAAFVCAIFLLKLDQIYPALADWHLIAVPLGVMLMFLMQFGAPWLAKKLV